MEIGRIQKKIKRNKKLMVLMIIILIFVLLWGVYMVAQIPYHEAKNETFQMAKKYAKVENINNFYIYNRNQTYYTIQGKNNNGQEVYVVIPKKGNRVDIFAKNKGISAIKANTIVKQNEAPKKIIHTVFGMKDDKTPLWEVAYLNKNNELCYAQISFKSGKVLQVLNDL